MNFLDDDEKMRDFFILTKEEFLASYSYLTEEEYDDTEQEIDRMGGVEALRRFGKFVPTVSTENTPELVGQMIDIFEDFLDEKKIIVPNRERDCSPDFDPDNVTNIYGDDYDYLQERISATLWDWGVTEKE